MIKSKFNLIKFSAGIFCALQLAGFIFILACPLPVSAQIDPQVTKTLKFEPQITIPNSDFKAKTEIDIGKYNAASGTMVSDLLPRYIKTFYDYGLAIAGILATIVLMGGGVIWLTSGGDSGKVSQAKELITGSITGVLILVVAWVILNTINPNLVNLKPINTSVVKKIAYCCNATKGNVLMEKNSNCPAGSSKCTGNQICKNSGNDVFKCIDDVGSRCCEYSIDFSERMACSSVTQNTTCPATKTAKAAGALASSTFKLSKYYDNFYCGDKVLPYGGGCKDGNCLGVENGKKCLNSDNRNGDGYCYNEVCYNKDGKIGDMCGNEGGICYESCPSGYDQDLGGRNCENSTCCKLKTI